MNCGLGAGSDEVTATFRTAPGGQYGSGSGTNEARRVYGMSEDVTAAVNNDDDDADFASDDSDDEVAGDDDLVELRPVGRVMGLCCPCLEHRATSVMSASLVTGTGNLTLYEDTAKTTGVGGAVQEGQPVYVEGIGPSPYPWADRLLWRWTDGNNETHLATNRFTVLSVRLFGDLDFDDDADAADKALHPALSREHDWAVPAATNVFRPVRLRTDVGLQGGAYTLSLAGESGAVRVWRDASGTNAAPLLVCGQTVTNGVNGVYFMTAAEDDLYVEAVSNGIATLTYSYAGSGAAAGINAAASMKMTAWGVDLDVDTDRDGNVGDDDEVGEGMCTLMRGAFVAPPHRALTGSGNDITGLATIRITTHPMALASGLSLKLKKTYVPSGCILHFITMSGEKLPDIGNGQSYSFSGWPTNAITVAVVPQYARPLSAVNWPIRFDLELQAVDTSDNVVCSDTVRLTVAPILLPPECNTPQHIYTTAIDGIPGATSMDALDAQTWAQDMVKFAKYQTADNQARDMFVDLEHPGKGSFPEKLRTVGGWDGANVWPVDMLGDGGNIMATPPLPDAPFGKLLIGSAKAGRPDPLPYWEGQGVQPAVRITTDWLMVGHVDEILMWVAPEKVLYADPWKASDLLHQEIAAGHQTNSLWFGFDAAGQNKTIQQVVVAPIGAGFKLTTLPAPGLSDLPSPATIVFTNAIFTEADILRVDDEILKITSVNGTTVTVARAQAGRPAAAHTAGNVIYAYTDVMKANLPVGAVDLSIVERMSTATNQLRQAIGPYSTTFIPMPVLFEYTTVEGASGYAAKSANVVNCLLSSGGTIRYAETGCAVFREYISTVLPSAEEIIGSWPLHCKYGEIHCATTTQRELDLDAPWWQQIDEWE